MPEGEEAPVYHSESSSNAAMIRRACHRIWAVYVLAVRAAASSTGFRRTPSNSQKQVADLTKRVQSAEARKPPAQQLA
jgi:hypothetical protein